MTDGQIDGHMDICDCRVAFATKNFNALFVSEEFKHFELDIFLSLIGGNHNQ